MDKTKNSYAVSLWKKSIKPNATAYTKLKDVAYFSIWKEKMESTAKSQGLRYLLDMEAVLKDMKLYKMQSTWFYKVLEDKRNTLRMSNSVSSFTSL